MKSFRFIAATTVLLLSTAASQAAVNVQDIGAQYAALGYSRVEIDVFAKSVKVEAINGTTKLEVILDRDSGSVLKSETEAVDAGDDTAPGIFVRDRTDDQGDSTDDNGSSGHGSDDVGTDDHGHHDGISDDSGSDDDVGDDHGSDHQSAEDEGSDDHGSSGHGSDDDGSHHDDDDDNGSDDHGDHGSDD